MTINVKILFTIYQNLLERLKMKTTFYCLFGFIILSLSNRSLAQESEKPFVVSPLIGDTLSLEERDYYNLFPTIDNFQWAVFSLNADSTLSVKVTYLKSYVQQDTIINNYRSLKSLVFHLNAAENPESMNPIKNEDYTGNEVRVLYNNGMEVSGNLLSATSSSLIVYSLNCDEDEIDINCATLIKPPDLEKLTVKSDFNLGRLIYPLVTGTIAFFIYRASLSESGSGSISESINESVSRSLEGFGVYCLGALVGVVISSAFPLNISSEEEYSIPINEDDIVGLSKISRYKDFEPYYNQQSK